MQANMSYSVERSTHKSETDQLSATLTKEKADHAKNNAVVSSFDPSYHILL